MRKYIILTLIILAQIAYAYDLPGINVGIGNIRIGNLRIHPYAKASMGYTDNIFKESRSEKGSMIYTVEPGILFQLPILTHFIQLNYHCRIERSERFHQEYDTEDHFLDGFINLNFGRLAIALTDRWQRATNPPDYQGDIRDQYYQNQFTGEVSYKLARRYKIRVFYTNEFRNYGNYRARPGAYDPELDNYWKNEYGFTFYYRIFPLTSVLIEYAFTDINNKDLDLAFDTDSENHRVWVGVKWEPTAKITGVIKGGFTRRDYDDDAVDDWDGFGLKVNTTYNFSSFTKFSVQAFREPIDTTVTTESVRITPTGRRIVSSGDYGTYYISTGVQFSVEQKFPAIHGLSARLYFSYTNDDYQEKGIFKEERDDDRYRYGIDVKYNPRKWFSAEVGYYYLTNESNFDWEDYRENMVIAHISLTF